MNAANANMSVKSESLSPAIGTVVGDIDLSKPLNADAIQTIRDAWYESGVVLFRNQEISELDQVRVGEYFGELSKVIKNREAGGQHHPSIMFISNIRENGELIGALPDGEVFFHSDHCFTPNPPAGTMLYGIEIPSRGGNTMFANMYEAYDTLDEGMKAKLEGLRALNVYDIASSANGYAMRLTSIPPEAMSCVHPIVKTHPITARRSLYVNRFMTHSIKDMARSESDELLNELFDHQEQQKFIYEHVWRPGDLLLWDNRCTLHARTDFDARERRLLRRLVIKSDENASRH